MTKLKYFKKDANRYVMKKEYTFGLIVSFGLAGIAAAGIWINELGIAWILGILSVLCFISIWIKDVTIDLDKKEFILKSGLIVPSIRVRLQDFQNFELVRTKQYLITTNTSLNICYLKDGKEKYAILSQGFTTQKMQNLANEIDEILHNHEAQR
ncbi:hypothetical protein [Flavobacterium sp. SLB02]|uniref:hypothetical protein n=1 Tax=Flavobacterium sp. SLB02 TaxID=2665645 RepID=UPI0012AA26E8|nr:hypothetical protein [Flavobacterium sp. SLB02]QGK73480.1 hypothetical protein GIY83_05210 [Flavobacterium sp. SLB02]